LANTDVAFIRNPEELGLDQEGSFCDLVEYLLWETGYNTDVPSLGT
jgi:hypothetical protein